MSEQNKDIARRIFDAWNARDFDAYDAIIAPTAMNHDHQNPFAETLGPEGTKQIVRMYTAAFSDQSFLINEQVAEGDFVVTRWTATGTNDGEMMGMPPSGKSVTVTGMTLHRIQDGMIVESWSNWDTLGMLQQLGVVPAPQAAQAQ